MFDELNRKSTVRDGINTEDMEFAPLKDFCGQKFKCDGFFFTEGKYGKQVVVVGGGYLINMPKRAVEQFETIQARPDLLEALLAGKLMIKDIKMIDTRNGKTTAYSLADA